MCDLSYDRRKANWKSQQAATLFKLQECYEEVSKTLLRKLKIGEKTPAFQQMDFHERSGNIVESNRRISFFYCKTVAVTHIDSANRQTEILFNCCFIHPVGGCGKGHIERCVSFCNPQTDAHARLFPAHRHRWFIHVYMPVDCFNSKASATIPWDAFPMTAACRHPQG